ncbi:MAG: enoyl-CoA hydratase [Neobacillus sp.]|nr:enoyl-CoA hydratase [Neobacillus sp.]
MKKIKLIRKIHLFILSIQAIMDLNMNVEAVGMSINFVTDKVNVKVNGRVATVEMNRPEALNALDVDMLKGLVCSLKKISDSDDIDIIVLKGSGRAFSSGGDIKTMLSNMNESDFYPVMDIISELVVTLYSIPKLTISAINGAAAGLGLSLALATDHIIADKNSKLAMNFIGIGLIPDGGAHFFLDKRVGEQKAMHIIWEGKMMDAKEAHELNLIQEIADDLQATVDDRVSEWLSRPVQAMIKTKKILSDMNRPQLLKILELEKHGQFNMRKTLDHKEGIRAFIEKRKPKFIGK